MLALVLPAWAQQAPFKGGEQLKYKLRYKWGVINADIAALDFNLTEENYQGEPCFRLRTNGATSNLAASLVKVSYKYDCRFTKDGLVPRTFYREQTEGNYWAKNNYTWDASGRQLHAIVDKSTRPHRDTLFTDKSIIYDVISVLYALRSADLEAAKGGRKLKFVAALDCNVSDVTVSYVKTENKKFQDLGTLEVDKFAMYYKTRKGGEKLDKESSVAISTNDDGTLKPIYVWVTPDGSHTLVGLSAEIAVGRVEGRLVEAKGLMTPLKLEK
jgi:hypothetical protein